MLILLRKVQQLYVPDEHDQVSSRDLLFSYDLITSGMTGFHAI